MTTFIWPYDGNQVSLAGTFNDWNPQPMKRDNDVGFSLTLPLENGTHHYKYVVDGRRWCYDILHPSTTDDRGNRNNIIEVGPHRTKEVGGGSVGVHPPAKGRGSAPTYQVETKEEEHTKGGGGGKPPAAAPKEQQQGKKGGGGDDGGKQQQNQKQQKQQQQGKKGGGGDEGGHQQQNQKQQQKAGQVSAVAKAQAANLIRTVKSYGVPFYVGDVECESLDDVLAAASIFQKALPDVGCMLISGGVEKFVVVAVVPEEKTGSITAVDWVNAALSVQPGHQATGTNVLAHGQIQANPDEGIFPIKLKDLCRGPTFVLLREKGLVKEEESEDEMYFFDE